MNRFFPYLCLLVFWLCGVAHADSDDALHTYTDWAVTCDNTRHCEAAGYQEDDADPFPVTFFLSRDAGPATPIKASLMVESQIDDVSGKLTIKVGKASLSGLSPSGELSAEQINTLLPQMLNASHADLSDGHNKWVLSLAGLKAALLDMDQQQGRIGTPGALIRKGKKPEASVHVALAAPVLIAASIPVTVDSDKKLLKPILDAVKDRDCWDEVPDDENPETSLTRLSSHQLLVMRDCMQGAYQSSAGVWIANDKPPYSPQRVLFPTAAGAAEKFVTDASFADGVMKAYAKGRGIGDCVYTSSWLWTAAGFKLLHEDVSAFCRGILGGGYPLRTWVAVQSK